MAGRDRMAIEEVVREVLREEHADVLRESVRAVAQELMEVEVVRHEALSVGRGERPRRWAVAAARRSWRQPELGTAGEGRSSLDNAGSCVHRRVARARQARRSGTTDVNR